MMKHARILAVSATFALLSAPVSAACYADYKAKRDDPLRLHYGTIEIAEESCTPRAVENEIRRRIAGDGWTLLNVLGVFDESGLAERKENAGKFHLRY